jgi:eukaryotic-like serine/threonine-protein kinase
MYNKYVQQDSFFSTTLSCVLPANPRMLFHVFLQDVMGEETTGKQTSNNNDNRTNTLLTDGNSTYGINLLYPSNWNKEANVSVSYSDNSTLTDVVRFSPPFENNNPDKSSENFDVKVDDVSDIQPVSLGKYTNATIEDVGQDFKIISLDTNAVVGGNNPAYKLIYTGIERDVNLHAMIVFTIKDDKAYIISYIAEPSRYSSDLPMIQKMINSIELVK